MSLASGLSMHSRYKMSSVGIKQFLSLEPNITRQVANTFCFKRMPSLYFFLLYLCNMSVARCILAIQKPTPTLCGFPSQPSNKLKFPHTKHPLTLPISVLDEQSLVGPSLPHPHHLRLTPASLTFAVLAFLKALPLRSLMTSQ